ncbi:MAG TPA: CpaF family protein, partial [Gammaproteobacteria bacterium]|nr:CpaF family protein [Gammaproteobacteria bacterium]
MDLRARLLVKYKNNIIDDLANETLPEKIDVNELPEAEKLELTRELPTQETIEAYLTEHESKYRSEVIAKVMEAIDLSKIGALDDSEARAQIQEITKSVIEELSIPLAIDSRKKLVQFVEDEILGLGPLEFLMRDNTISEIMVNGAKTIFVEQSGRLIQSPVVFDDDKHVMKIIDRIVSFVGRRIDESSPLADARLADGSRVNIIIPPLALDGPTITIRRFPADPLTLEGLVNFKALSPGMAEFLKSIVKIGKNILISGGTGSGKTTTLNALSAYIPDTERIVTIEDAAELQLQQAHVVRLETRPMNIEGTGEISQRDLVKNALRMRPDRIVIGEVRGAEAMDMLQAMNTGHDGSLTTTHANTPRDA